MLLFLGHGFIWLLTLMLSPAFAQSCQRVQSILEWTRAQVAAKVTPQSYAASKSGLPGDLIDWLSAFFEQTLGTYYALVKQPLQGRHTRDCPELSIEGPSAHHRLTCQIVDVERIGQVFDRERQHVDEFLVALRECLCSNADDLILGAVGPW